jgi:hypothetical protein
MSLSMYDLSIPVLVRGFATLSDYLDKAASHAAESGIDPAVLVNARLAPDMLPLAGQVQRASDSAKGAIGRLAAIETPSFPDTEATFADLKGRVAKTVAFLRAVDPAQLAGSENRMVEVKVRGGRGILRGDTYLLQILLPNFFFHVATAHDILRHSGLKIGKKDYLGTIDYSETFES